MLRKSSGRSRRVRTPSSGVSAGGSSVPTALVGGLSSRGGGPAVFDPQRLGSPVRDREPVRRRPPGLLEDALQHCEIGRRTLRDCLKDRKPQGIQSMVPRATPVKNLWVQARLHPLVRMFKPKNGIPTAPAKPLSGLTRRLGSARAACRRSPHGTSAKRTIPKHRPDSGRLCPTWGCQCVRER